MLLWSTDVADRSTAPTFAMLRDAGYEGIEVPIFDRENSTSTGALGERLASSGSRRSA